MHDASDRYGELEIISKSQIDQLKKQLEKSSSNNSEMNKELERANNVNAKRVEIVCPDGRKS